MDNYYKQALPKTQRTQGIENLDSFNGQHLKIKEKLQQALKSWSNFELVRFVLAKGKKYNNNNNNNFDKSMQHL